MPRIRPFGPLDPGMLVIPIFGKNGKNRGRGAVEVYNTYYFTINVGLRYIIPIIYLHR